MTVHWYVYIIQSGHDDSYYVGHTHDPDLRLTRHNDGWTRSTKGKRPWKIVYVESVPSKGEAMRRERQIKSMKSRTFIERLIAHAGGRPACPDDFCRGSRHQIVACSGIGKSRLPREGPIIWHPPNDRAFELSFIHIP